MFLNTREIYVQEMYEKIGINNPTNIDEWKISSFFDIDLKYRNGESYRAKRTIFLNNNNSIKEQRVDFFHELAHIIRQYTGNQLFTPKSISDWLEWDADIFAMYACLPWHMIKQYDLTDEALPCHLSDDFMVPHDMVYKRLQQIKQRLTL